MNTNTQFTHKFTDREITIHAPLNGTLIRATMRSQDLIPAFMSAIRETAEYAQMLNVVPAYALEDDDAEYWDSEECSMLLNEELFDILNHYAPDGYYFGAHIGDGSDYGYWESEEEQF